MRDRRRSAAGSARPASLGVLRASASAAARRSRARASGRRTATVMSAALLDEQDRDAVVADPAQRLEQRLDDRRREPERRLVEQQHVRAARRARARSRAAAAGRPTATPAWRLANSATTGKSPRTQSRSSATPSWRAPPGEPEPQVLVDGQRRRRCAGPRARARRPTRAMSSGRAAQRAARRAGSRRRERYGAPMIAWSVVDLPAPFGPISPTISPRSSSRLEPAHGRDGAVAHVDVAQLEHGAQASAASTFEVPAPRYAVATSKFRRISSGVPSASVRPRSSTWTRSQTSMISATLWSISSTPAPKSSRTERTTAAKAGISRLVQPRRRLVHQHEPRPERERARDAEPPLVAVRQDRGRLRRPASARPEQVEQLVGAPARLAGRDAGAQRRDLDVLAHGQPAEEPPVLERPREPGAAAPVRRPARDLRRRRARSARTTAGRSRSAG